MLAFARRASDTSHNVLWSLLGALLAPPCFPAIVAQSARAAPPGNGCDGRAALQPQIIFHSFLTEAKLCPILAMAGQSDPLARPSLNNGFFPAGKSCERIAGQSSVLRQGIRRKRKSLASNPQAGHKDHRCLLGSRLRFVCVLLLLF